MGFGFSYFEAEDLYGSYDSSQLSGALFEGSPNFYLYNGWSCRLVGNALFHDASFTLEFLLALGNPERGLFDNCQISKNPPQSGEGFFKSVECVLIELRP